MKTKTIVELKAEVKRARAKYDRAAAKLTPYLANPFWCAWQQTEKVLREAEAQFYNCD